jgi:hypothetical protein
MEEVKPYEETTPSHRGSFESPLRGKIERSGSSLALSILLHMNREKIDLEDLPLSVASPYHESLEGHRRVRRSSKAVVE